MDDKAWYAGDVSQFDGGEGRHLVNYDDGDEEWVDFAAEKYQLLPGGAAEGSETCMHYAGCSTQQSLLKAAHSQPACAHTSYSSCGIATGNLLQATVPSFIAVGALRTGSASHPFFRLCPQERPGGGGRRPGAGRGSCCPTRTMMLRAPRLTAARAPGLSFRRP